MIPANALPQLATVLQIVVVDIMLSADNALVIALACRSLPPQDRRGVYAAGMIGAVLMRLAFASGVVFLLQVPYLKLLGGAVLTFIAIRLAAEPVRASDAADGKLATPLARAGVVGAVVAILAGDAAMSLDNVVAVAALANGDIRLLVLGIAISVPLLVYGSTLLMRLMQGWEALVLLGGMILGWVAGSVAVSDPAIASWVAQQAPALPVTLPAGAAALVPWQVLILRRRTATVLPGA